VVDLQERDRHVDDAGVGSTLGDRRAELRAASPEAAVEVVDAADRSDDVGDRDLPAADREACPEPETATDLLEREEVRSIATAELWPHHRSVADGPRRSRRSGRLRWCLRVHRHGDRLGASLEHGFAAVGDRDRRRDEAVEQRVWALRTRLELRVCAGVR